MDLKQLATVESHEAGAEYQLLNPQTGKLEDVVITVQGLDSKAWREGQKAQRKKYENNDQVEFLDHEYLAPIIAGCIIGWKNLEKDGKLFKHSQENALWLCSNSPMVVSQLFSFMLDRSNFIKD
jgi:hypothetical protein